MIGQIAKESTEFDMERDQLLNRYNHLSQQSDTLRHRLNLSSPGWDTYSPASDSDDNEGSDYSFPRRRRRNSMGTNTTTPTRTHHSTRSHNTSPSSRRPSSMSFSTSSTFPLGPVSSLPSAGTTAAHAEQGELHEVVQQMKAELTELLNCESVKHDKTFRHWVQARLMDAELELRQYRRRRSSAGVTEKTLRAFADHLAGH